MFQCLIFNWNFGALGAYQVHFMKSEPFFLGTCELGASNFMSSVGSGCGSPLAVPGRITFYLVLQLSLQGICLPFFTLALPFPTGNICSAIHEVLYLNGFIVVFNRCNLNVSKYTMYTIYDKHGMFTLK